MLRRVTELEATYVLAGTFRLKRFVERPHRVSVQAIANQFDPIAVGDPGVSSKAATSTAQSTFVR